MEQEHGVIGDQRRGDNRPFLLVAPADQVSRAPSEYLERALAELTNAETQTTGDVDRITSSLRDNYREARLRILGRDIIARLDTYRQAYGRDYSSQFAVPRYTTDKEIRQESLRQHTLSRRFAHDIGADLNALRALQKDSHRRSARQVNSLPQTGMSEIEVTFPDYGFNHAPQGSGAPTGPAFSPPPPTPWVIHQPPYNAGWWNRGGKAFALGSGQIMMLASHLNYDTSICGNVVWGQDWNCGDIDMLSAYLECGFMVWHTMQRTGLLEVEADLQCGLCQHTIETNNEWGWSDGHAVTGEKVVMSVFWNWEDTTPASESYDGTIVQGLKYSGNGDYGPGVYHPVASGQYRKARAFSTTAFKVGTTLVIYVGTRQHFFASINDVGTNIWVDSRWFMPEIRVREA